MIKDRKDKRINIRLTDDEYNHIVAQAEGMRMTLSYYAHALLNERVIRSEEEIRLIGRVSQLSGLLSLFQMRTRGEFTGEYEKCKAIINEYITTQSKQLTQKKQKLCNTEKPAKIPKTPERRTQKLFIRVTEKERHTIMTKAMQKGMTISEYGRELICFRQVIRKDYLNKLQELDRLGRKFKKALDNIDRKDITDTGILCHLKAIRSYIKNLTQELLIEGGERN